MHLKRLIIALIIVPFFYLYVMHLPAPYFLGLITFFATVALAEFYTMYRLTGVMKYMGMLWGCLLMVVFFAAHHLFLDLLLLAVLITMGIRLFMKRDPRSSLEDISTTMLGVLYLPGLLSFQLSLVREGPAWIVLLYASVWASDSMAYYIGKSIGKKKLYEEISPNKTVAGGVGSVFGGIIGAVLITATIMKQVPIGHAIVIGAAVGITTVIGDLVESMFKREAGVKDSSTLVPGHGGILDKLDGATFAGPALYWVSIGLGLIR